MEFDRLIEIIKSIAIEQGYEITDGERKFQVFIDNYNAVAFEILVNSSSGYIQVHQWEGGDTVDGGKYGRGVYSLRNYSDTINFCNIMIASAAIRARRRN
jgi:hypothetical protein